MYIEERAAKEQAARFKETGKLLACVPFSGFYETIHYRAISEVAYIGESGVEKHGYNFKAMEKAYGAVYARLFGEALDITLTFDELTSPKDYNYGTDSIFALMTAQDATRLLEGVDYEKMKQLVKDKHSSYDGFWSFVDNDYDNWLKKDITEWTEFQLETLLYYHDRQNRSKGSDTELDLYYQILDCEREWQEAGYEDCKCGECPVACEDCQVDESLQLPNEFNMHLCEDCLNNRKKENN